MENKTSFNGAFLTFDPDRGSIEIVIETPPESGERYNSDFRIELVNQSENYLKLLSLFDVDKEAIKVPTECRVKDRDLSVFSTPGKDPRNHIVIGEGIQNKKVEVNLKTHFLISGSKGSGKANILKNLLLRNAEQSNISSWLIDTDYYDFGATQDLSLFIDRSSDRVFFGSESIVTALNEAIQEIHNRYEMLRSRGFDFYDQMLGDDSVPAIHIVINDYNNVINRSNHTACRLIVDRINEISRLGKFVGVFLIVSTDDITDINDEALRNFFTRVLMSNPAIEQLDIERDLSKTPLDNIGIFDSKHFKIDPFLSQSGQSIDPQIKDTKASGRGVIFSWAGGQSLFQAYHIG